MMNTWYDNDNDNGDNIVHENRTDFEIIAKNTPQSDAVSL